MTTWTLLSFDQQPGFIIIQLMAFLFYHDDIFYLDGSSIYYLMETLYQEKDQDRKIRLLS